MASKKLTIGADRFLALEWANYAYELFISMGDQATARDSLRMYLEDQIEGKESSRKTAIQLNRLWLTSEDSCDSLRKMTLSFPNTPSIMPSPIFHLGLAINIFPIYKQCVLVVGTLAKIMDSVTNKAIVDRVMERFPSPTSIPRAVGRVLQTLKDWGFIDLLQNRVTIKEIHVVDPDLVNWYILALLQANSQSEITLQELENCPFKLGVNFLHLRKAINQSSDLFLSRSYQGYEVIRRKQMTLE